MTDTAGRSRGHMLLVFGPVLALGAVGALLAVAAAYAGWHAELMQSVATGTGRGGHAARGCPLLPADRPAPGGGPRPAQASKPGSTASSSRRWTPSSPWMTINASCCSMPRRKKCSAIRAARCWDKPLEMLMPARLRDAHHEHIKRFGTTGTTSRRMGDQTVLVGQPRRRRGISDRGVDLAAQRGRPQVFHGHPARRDRTRARRRRIAPFARRVARARGRREFRPRTGEKPRRARVAR